ncbi:MAG TPA: LLM class flavin-dependent oxidoreductase [Anaerolineales bacterium]|nr:LLM class flavin-dependent oxidoreductase [Anaerolineales bacterium]
MDYRRPIQFGYFPTPAAASYPELLRLAQLCDALGMDLIGIQDHPYQSRFMDTWTLLSALAAQTARIRFFPDVINLPLRPPAVLAKAAASLDIISGGRIELGLGAGAFWEAIAAMGGPVRTPGEAVAALEEAIQVIRLMWSGQRGLRFDGQHYRLKGVHSGPVPAHPIGIWIGAYGPRMLALTGRLGDGWVPTSTYAPPDKLPEMHRRIDSAALSAGRDPGMIQRVYNLMGQIQDRPGGEPFIGPVGQWVAELTRLVLEFGMDTFIIGFPEPPGDQIERFMAEIAPRVRENVAGERSVSRAS